MQKHWADQLAGKVKDERGDKDSYIFNSGMSISGKMHIGNLRGELAIPSRVKRILEQEGKDVKFYGIYYTQDRFKAKDSQLEKFDDPEEAEKYEGWRLVDVPDPEGCHENWVEHFNSENQPYLPEYGIEVEPLTTTEFYRMDETKELIRKFLENKERVRQVLNEYRDRQPYPEGWIPFDPRCESCNRIDKTDAKEIDFEEDRVRYECKACGDEGWSPIEKGKLAWRLEWSALWEVLDVDFEPYGKDHATPGGSRDSCVALAEEFDLNYPTGFSFNWVYWKREGEVKGDMTSSGDRGITTKAFLDYAEPEVLTYLYLSTKPMKEIYFDPDKLPDYVRRFDRAESIYFGEEEARDEKREENIKRNYELAMLDLPEKSPVRIPYKAACMIYQLVESEDRRVKVAKKLEDVPSQLSEEDRKRVLERIEMAGNWLGEYPVEDFRIEVQEEVSEEARDELSEEELKALKSLGEDLEEELSAKEAQSKVYELSDDFDIGAGEAFQSVYLTILGKESGPRAGNLIKAVGQEKVRDLIDQL
ncbi:MAG: lysine--tRNA ligase [Candidatus Nanohaloarchaeota archaeon QJJ-9]|nr:lysine--tRNA ligase [Candidatus Nanohaloarchaeota archaeon QJJ-9]